MPKIILNLPDVTNGVADSLLVEFLERLEQMMIDAPGSGVVYDEEVEDGEEKTS